MASPRSTPELWRRFVAAVDALPDVVGDDGPCLQELWHLVDALQRRATRPVVDRGLAMLTGPGRQRRIWAAHLLAQLGYRRGRPCGAEILPVAARLAREESDPEVRAALVSVIGLGEDPAWLAELRRYAADPEAGVRWQVAADLPSLVSRDAEGNALPDDATLDTLLALMRDDDPHVRDWATFCVGSQIGTDSPRVRDALWAQLFHEPQDPHDDTVEEAMIGLARRRDPRLAAWLAEQVERVDPDAIGTSCVEAIGYAADPAMAPALALLREKKDWPDEEYVDVLLTWADCRTRGLAADDDELPPEQRRTPGCRKLRTSEQT